MDQIWAKYGSFLPTFVKVTCGIDQAAWALLPYREAPTKIHEAYIVVSGMGLFRSMAEVGSGLNGLRS